MAYEILLEPVTTGPTVYYRENDYLPGKYARLFDAGSVNTDMLKFSVPGTWGSYVVRTGAQGHKITMVVRYIETLENIEAQIKEDTDYYSMGAYDITHAGIKYTGCNLVQGSVKKQSAILPTGRDISGGEIEGLILFVDVSMQFSEDNPTVLSF